MEKLELLIFLFVVCMIFGTVSYVIDWVKSLFSPKDKKNDAQKNHSRGTLSKRNESNTFQAATGKLNSLGLSVSLRELMGSYDASIDNIIIKEEQRENCRYIGGEFKISCIGESQYQCSYALYFQNPTGQYHSLEANTKALNISGLTKDFQNELRRERVLKFEIDQPRRR